MGSLLFLVCSVKQAIGSIDAVGSTLLTLVGPFRIVGTCVVFNGRRAHPDTPLCRAPRSPQIDPYRKNKRERDLGTTSSIR